MLNRIFALLATVASGAMTAACATVTDVPRASDTSPSRENSSWCQGDAPIRYRQADRADQDDPGNRLDSDATVTAIQEHNERYRPACPDDSERTP